ncbi:MAG: SUMF1/EgtB/PvdO family nonheme iron enzyme, partial [Gammaproteobacteria bacterium]|nr:SUMF1/EgtB/PvdO family nonheme iron enzyme [Gammaproteobacteria bacterium]
SELVAADDVFVTTTAPKQLLDGRLKVAAENARLDRFTNALKQIDLADALGVNDPRIAEARARYTDQRNAYLTATTGGMNDIRAMGAVLGRLQASMDDYAVFAARLQRLLKKRIEELAPANRSSAENLFAAAQTPFPSLDINWPVTKAPAPRQEPVPEPPVVAEVTTPRPGTSTSPVRPSTTTQTGLGKVCRTSIAGQGKSRNCYDELSDNVRLPILVVIPGLGGGAPFAMSRSEVSIKDFNLYCVQSGACNSLTGNSSLPATNLGISQMQAYVEWLSSVSGAQYSLPTLAQWQHAARAGGGAINPSINCVRNVGGRQADGFELVNVSMGGKARANDWGLRQIFGNAQEVVSQGGAFVAAGGAYSDRVSDCTPDFTRTVSGAEERTGFRIVRMIN